MYFALFAVVLLALVEPGYLSLNGAPFDGRTVTDDILAALAARPQ